jgi:hypothetical protein
MGPLSGGLSDETISGGNFIHPRGGSLKKTFMSVSSPP